MKKIRLKYQGSPLEPPKVPPSILKQKGKKLMFDDDLDVHQSDEVSQDTMLATHGEETLSDRYITDLEWTMQYVDSSKKVVLITARNKGPGQLVKERPPFGYGRILKLDYEEPDSDNLVILIECTKGLRKVWVNENLFVKESCGPESFRLAIEQSNNLITTLRPYIQGHVSLKEHSPSPVKAAPKKVHVHSRPARKKVTKLSESEASSSTDDEEATTTPGAELSSGVLSSDQNKIRREIIQKKLVRKGQVFNLPITHIHRPPVDEKTGRRPLEIREPHKLHVQNLKKKMKINPHATVVPFIVMVDPDECACLEDFDVRKHDQYNYFVIGGSHSAEARRQLVREHPTTYFFRYAECKIYVSLTMDEAKLLAWDHNNDNDYRQKMSSIERI